MEFFAISRNGKKRVEILKQFLNYFDTPQEQESIKKAIIKRNDDFNLNGKSDCRKKE